MGNPAPDRPATVLLVDDDDDTRLILRRLLEVTRRFRVVGEAAGGREGIEKARSLRPDLVVLDLDMPGMNGMDALPLIRAASQDSKVMVFSDGAMTHDPPKAEERGAHVVRQRAPGWTQLSRRCSA